MATTWLLNEPGPSRSAERMDCRNPECQRTDIDSHQRCESCSSAGCEYCVQECPRCSRTVCMTHLKDMSSADKCFHFDRFKLLCEDCLQLLIEELQFSLHGAPVEERIAA